MRKSYFFIASLSIALSGICSASDQSPIDNTDASPNPRKPCPLEKYTTDEKERTETKTNAPSDENWKGIPITIISRPTFSLLELHSNAHGHISSLVNILDRAQRTKDPEILGDLDREYQAYRSQLNEIISKMEKGLDQIKNSTKNTR